MALVTGAWRWPLLVVKNAQLQTLSSGVHRTAAVLDVQGQEVKTGVPGPLRTGAESSFRKGTGGRNSFSGNVITVFGSTGLLGLPVVNRLLRQGAQVIIPYRSDAYWLREHKVSAELGQILFFPFFLKNDDSIRKVVKYSNIVINLIGSHIETGNFSFFDVHEEGARRLARISREMGVERFIHFSALNASQEPKPVLIPGGSRFLRSKALGEIAVREEFPEATIVRPAAMFAEADKFISSYISYIRKTPLFDKVGMYGAGEDTFKMPVFMNDVAFGVQKIVNDPLTVGQTFEFVGPHCYQLSELVDFMFHKAKVLPELGFTYSRRNGYGPWMTAMTNVQQLWERIRKKRQWYNWEWLETTECTSDVLTGQPGLLDLGLPALTDFEYTGGRLVTLLSFRGSAEETYSDEVSIKRAALPLRSPPLYAKKTQKNAVQTTQTKIYGSNVAVSL